MDWIKEEQDRIGKEISRYITAGKQVIASSSFQSHSIPLLHVISTISAQIPVYFLETGFHFPETIQFKNHLAESLNLDIRSIESPISKVDQLNSKGMLMYAVDPDLCCYYNKVLPMDAVLNADTVWLSGLRKGQTAFRDGLSKEMKGSKGSLRYHPVLEWTNKMVWDYKKNFDLPSHPLEAKGYFSIGCAPCTSKPDINEVERINRWEGQKKTECGLHTELIKS